MSVPETKAKAEDIILVAACYKTDPKFNIEKFLGIKDVFQTLNETHEGEIESIRKKIDELPEIQLSRLVNKKRQELSEWNESDTYVTQIKTAKEEILNFIEVKELNMKFNKLKKYIEKTGKNDGWNYYTFEKRGELKVEYLDHFDKKIENLYRPLRKAIKRYIICLRAYLNQYSEYLSDENKLNNQNIHDKYCNYKMESDKFILKQPLYCLHSESGQRGTTREDIKYKNYKVDELEDDIFIETFNQLMLDQHNRIKDFKNVFQTVIELIKQIKTEKENPLFSKEAIQIRQILDELHEPNELVDALREMFYPSFMFESTKEEEGKRSDEVEENAVKATLAQHNAKLLNFVNEFKKSKNTITKGETSRRRTRKRSRVFRR